MDSGKKLLELRQERWAARTKVDGKRASQSNLAYMAGVDPRTLRNLENGLADPKYATLTALLGALDEYAPVQPEVKRDIFAGFSLKLPELAESTELPTAAEIKLAADAWLETYPFHFPACLTDVAQNVLAWNRYVPRLLGLAPDDPRVSILDHITIFDFVFGVSPAYYEITNRVDYLRGLLRGLKYTYWPHRHEGWCRRQIAGARAAYPDFSPIWDSLSDEPPPFPSYENTVPLNLRITATGAQLSFGIITSRFRSDHRFRIVQLMPLDSRTHLQCQLWTEEHGPVA